MIKNTIYNLSLQFLGGIREVYYTVIKKFPPKRHEASDEFIDVLIPIVEKDLQILPLSLKGIRNCINHSIKDIYIISRSNEKVRKFCEENDVIYVNEKEMLGYGPEDLNLVVGHNSTDRSGWIFQQLLKLSGNIGTCRYFITIDADHVLIQPHTFLTKSGKLIFYRSKQSHKAYYRNIVRLMGMHPFTILSYVSHKMIFDKELLKELQKDIENRWHQPWDKAVINSLDKTEASGFSEFELFGNFCPTKRKKHIAWRERKLHYADFDTYENLRKRFSGTYLSVTFPEYLKNK